LVAAFAQALVAHRDFGDAAAIDLPRTARHRLFLTAVRGALQVLGERGGARRAVGGSLKAAVGRLPKRPAPARAGSPGSGRATQS
jgi:hypothetical protein